MAITQRLDLRQTQSLVMTPQLQQAIKLLQLSNVELSEYVEDELKENPMLERDDGEPTSGKDQEIDRPNNALTEVNTDDEITGPDTLDLAAGGQLPDPGEKPLDMEYENIWDDQHPHDINEEVRAEFESYTPIGSGGRSDFNEFLGDFEATLSEERTLREHLLEQLTLDLTDGPDRIIGLHLIDMIDESGWLSGRIIDIADLLGCEVTRIEFVLSRLQQFEPPGIFARDLKECLSLQLRDKGRLDPAMTALIDNLELLGRRDKVGLLKICGVDEEDLSEMVAEIRALDPKPGMNFREEMLQSVNPDILMQHHPDGGWYLELNQETLPRVLVNTEYFARVNKGVRDKAEKEFIHEKFQTANWLVKSLHQRATTILRVATEIVKMQEPFFRLGVEHLKPLILRDIAESIEMHESTVSRVTSNKFMATPRGLYELKYFFTSSIQSLSGGEAHSAESVRFRIKALIDGEKQNSILSDDKIVGILKHDGINIARRTVAKYRESMRIGSSVERRKIKGNKI